MEEDLWWKTTLGGGGPSVEGNLWWKTTLGGDNLTHYASLILERECDYNE